MMANRRRLMKGFSLASAIGATLLALAACGGGSEGPDVLATVEGKTATIHVTSPAFENGGRIPATFTCDGADEAPALVWESVPAGAQSLALIMEDPDAPGGTWTHWVMYSVNPESSGFPEGATDRVLQGENDFDRTGYGGPCPPSGGDHRYFFRLYALDSELDLGPGATKSELLAAMDGHVVGVGQLMGTYGR
jgi:Raf kinase inhibitor-like YbhB/YbcL family protein